MARSRSFAWKTRVSFRHGLTGLTEMPEAVPLAFMPSGKHHAIFLLGLHHDSKTEISFEHKDHSDALVSFYASTPSKSQYSKFKRFRRSSEGNPIEVIKLMIV
jgi:hypothetical protein